MDVNADNYRAWAIIAGVIIVFVVLCLIFGYPFGP